MDENRKSAIEPDESRSIVVSKTSEKDINEWLDQFMKTAYILKNYKHVDLVDEFSDAESFLIDGDSILLECFASENLDWTHGGQYLHLMYLSEKFLQIFIKQGGNFKVIFFKEAENLLYRNEGILLARTLLRMHLKHNSSVPVLDEFRNPWDPSFLKYVHREHPNFILIGEHLEDSYEGFVRPEHKFYFFALLLQCLALKFNCASTMELEVTASAMHGFHIRSHFKHKKFMKEWEQKLIIIWNHLLFRKGFEECKEKTGKLMASIMSEVTRFCQETQCPGSALRMVLHISAAVIFLMSQKRKAQEVSSSDAELVRFFLLHCVMVSTLPLKYRAQAIVPVSPKLKTALISRGKLLSIFHQLLSSYEKILVNGLSTECLPDLVDCNMWMVVAEVSHGLHLYSHQVYAFLLNTVSKFAEVDLTVENKVTEMESSVTPLGKKSGNFPLQLPLVKVENEIIAHYSAKLLDSQQLQWEGETFQLIHTNRKCQEQFDETYHWHSGKPLSDDYDRTKSDGQMPTDPFERKKNQAHLASFMTRYGRALEGDRFVPQVLVVDKTGKKQTKKAGKGESLTSTEKLKLKILKDKELQREQNETREWKALKQKLKEKEDKSCYREAVEMLRASFPKFQVHENVAQLLLKELKLLSLQHHHDSSSSLLKEAFVSARTLWSKYQTELSEGDKKDLKVHLTSLGFDDLVEKLNLPGGEVSGSKRVKSARFQMKHLGSDLQEESKGDADPRVKNFIPDNWQKKMFDAIDDQRSCLIVAPTSSGKTYASYYCMEKVLRNDDSGIVVFVSPTKALVNQVSATVTARFTKSLPDGMCLLGEFTRDRRRNVMNCQILVTVPECLQILMLAPHRQKWVGRIRYVIFDEVHCIGGFAGEGRGQVWEHMILMTRCPIIALSATVENPDTLLSWLQEAEDFKYTLDQMQNRLRSPSPKSYKVSLIKHTERHAHLKKYAFLTKVPRGLNVTDTLESIHPCGVISTKLLSSCRGFPDHVTMSPEECLQLFDVMTGVWDDVDDLRELEPESFFSGVSFLKMSDVKHYEMALKDRLWNEVNSGNVENVENVIAALRSGLHCKMEENEKNFPNCYERGFLTNNFFRLMEVLRNRSMFPVIVFCQERALTLNLVDEAVKGLKEKEDRLPKKRKEEPHQAKEEDSPEKPSKKNSLDGELRERKSGKNNKDIRLSTKSALQPKSKASPILDNPPDPSCSYTNMGVCDSGDLAYITSRLEREKKFGKDAQKNSVLRFVEGLRHGLSSHHGGLNSNYRRTTEMLFQMKFLNVVCATSTLALGIHMPCKTVVFAGDAIYLNSLGYRQMSGRAGRRGFDQEGNVVFFGLTEKKIARLMTANLPKILGNFPLNISLVLRMFLLLSRGKNREDALARCLCLLQHPLIRKDQPELDEQLKLHFFFSVQYLVRMGLLDTQGNPLGLTGLVSHLHYHEPANFIFASLIGSSVFHEMFCTAFENGEKADRETLKEVIVILSHLFGRVRLHRNYSMRTFKNSVVQLQPIPNRVKEVFDKHNKEVSVLFDAYLRSTADYVHQKYGEEVKLPLSAVKFKSSQGFDPPANTLERVLMWRGNDNKVCSAFASLSGHKDENLYQIDELITNLRSEVYTDAKVVPVMKYDQELNSYAWDFFNHGIQDALIYDNGLEEKGVYNLLKDFKLMISAIAVSLAEMGPEDDPVVKLFAQLDDEFSIVFEKCYN